MIDLLAAAFTRVYAISAWNDLPPARIDTRISETRGLRRKVHFIDPIIKTVVALERSKRVQGYDFPSPDLDDSIFGLIFVKAGFAS